MWGHTHCLPNRITTYLPAGCSSPYTGSTSPSYSTRIREGWAPPNPEPQTCHSCSLCLPVVNWDEAGHEIYKNTWGRPGLGGDWGPGWSLHIPRCLTGVGSKWRVYAYCSPWGCLVSPSLLQQLLHCDLHPDTLIHLWFFWGKTAGSVVKCEVWVSVWGVGVLFINLGTWGQLSRFGEHKENA